MFMITSPLSQLVKGEMTVFRTVLQPPQGMNGRVKNKINDGLNTQRGDVSVLSDTSPE